MLRLRTMTGLISLKSLAKRGVLVLCFMWAGVFSQTAPGGVSSSLALWNKANAGISYAAAPAISGWTDQTGVNTFTVVGTPKWQGAPLNYNPTVLFDGSSRFVGGTSISNVTQAFGVGKIVNAGGSTSSGAFIGTVGVPYGSKYFFHTENSKLYCSGTLNGIYTAFTGGPSIGYSLLSEDLSQTGVNDQMRLNGLSKANYYSGSDPAIYTGVPTLGSRDVDNFSAGSELAEAVIYTVSLTGTQVRQVESYLALKYGITLDNSAGGATGNYLSSAATTVWTASISSTYHHNIIGIARDDNSALLQMQSHQADDTTRVYLAALAAANSSNTGSFSGDKQFVVMGNNTLPLQTAAVNANEYPPGLGIYSRIAREWKINNVNFDGTFSMDVTLSTTPVTASNLRILIDYDDGNFINATMFNPGITYAGGVVTIPGLSTAMIAKNTAAYLTIVSLSSQTPLPIELLDFTATVMSNDEVKLDWQTATQTNNNYFTLEKSKDAANWEELIRVKGAGTTTSYMAYTEPDAKPYTGTSYYRLKQTDFNGAFTYSKIRVVNVDESNSVKIYPNPAQTQITIEGGADELEEVNVYNLLGQNMDDRIKISRPGETKVLLDISTLSKGVYYIKTSSTAKEVFVQ